MRISGRSPGSLTLPSLGTLILLAVGFRLPALFLLRYGGPVPDWSDFRYYHEMAALSAQGFYPDIHYWVEYPPLFPWLAVGAYRLSLLIPPWINPTFWFNFVLSVVLAAADAGSLVMIDRLGDAFWGAPAGRRSAVLYAAMFLPMFALLGWFDTLPTFFMLTALMAVVSARRTFPKSGHAGGVFAGVAIGIGAMLKLFPLLALPTAIISTARQNDPFLQLADSEGIAHVPSSQDSAERGGKGAAEASCKQEGFSPRLGSSLLFAVIVTAATLVTVALIAAPFLVLSPATFLATFRNVLARGSWMSPWALLDGYYGTGVVPSLTDRLFYTASASWGQPERDPALWYLATAIGGGLYLWRAWRAWNAGTARAAIALTGFGAALLVLLSRGFSQQFSVWLLPFVAIMLPGIDGAILAVVLTLNNLVLEGYLYVTLFPTLHRLLWISVTVRTILVIWLAIECAVAIEPKVQGRWHGLRRKVALPAFAMAVVALIVAGAAVVPQMEVAMLKRTGFAPVVAAIRQTDPATVVVFTQPDLYSQLAAELGPRPALVLAEPHLLKWTGDQSLYHRMDVALRGHPGAVLITDSAQSQSPVAPSVLNWLDAHFGALPAKKLGAIQYQAFSLSDRPPRRHLGVTFGNALVLESISPPDPAGRPGNPLTVTLQWRAVASVRRDYTVSLQLIDSHGKLAAQHDAMPANNTMPTSLWKSGDEVDDRIDLPLPATLAPGQYSLIVVMYDHQTLQRLQTKGTGAAGDHAVIGSVRVAK